MNPSPLCSLCSKSPSRSFCPCTAPEVFLCELCTTLHTAHFPGVHRLLPLSAFGPHRSPDYFSRLQARRDLVASGSQKLAQNIHEVDRCIAQLYDELNRVTRAIWEYGQKFIVELEAVKASLEASAKFSLEEAEKTMYEETPRLAGEFSESMRTGGRLAPFQYQLAVVTDLESILRLDYNVGGVTRDVCVPLIVLNSLQTFNLRTSRVAASVLPVSFPYGFVCCLLNETNAIVVGSIEPPMDTAHKVDLMDSKVSNLEAMGVARGFPGIVKEGGFVYVFGGEDGQKNLAACEKFAVAGQTWTRVKDMLSPKARFCPCVYDSDIYLPQFAKTTGAIEAFSIEKEEFRLLEVVLPAAISPQSVAFVVSGDLVVISTGGELYRLTAEGKFRMERVTMQGKASVLSSITPVVEGRQVSWARAEDGQLVQYHLGGHSLREE